LGVGDTVYLKTRLQNDKRTCLQNVGDKATINKINKLFGFQTGSVKINCTNDTSTDDYYVSELSATPPPRETTAPAYLPGRGTVLPPKVDPTLRQCKDSTGADIAPGDLVRGVDFPEGKKVKEIYQMTGGFCYVQLEDDKIIGSLLLTKGSEPPQVESNTSAEYKRRLELESPQSLGKGIPPTCLSSMQTPLTVGQYAKAPTSNGPITVKILQHLPRVRNMGPLSDCDILVETVFDTPPRRFLVTSWWLEPTSAPPPAAVSKPATLSTPPVPSTLPLQPVSTPGFFEAQEGAGCGRHALNNLIGGLNFTRGNSNVVYDLGNPVKPVPLQSVCALLKTELPTLDCPDSENYDINVLRAGLNLYGYPVLQQENTLTWRQEPDDFGYVVNFGGGHWVALRKDTATNKLLYINSIGGSNAGIPYDSIPAFLTDMQAQKRRIPGILVVKQRSTARIDPLETLRDVRLSAIQEVAAVDAVTNKKIDLINLFNGTIGEKLNNQSLEAYAGALLTVNEGLDDMNAFIGQFIDNQSDKQIEEYAENLKKNQADLEYLANVIWKPSSALTPAEKTAIPIKLRGKLGINTIREILVGGDTYTPLTEDQKKAVRIRGGYTLRNRISRNRTRRMHGGGPPPPPNTSGSKYLDLIDYNKAFAVIKSTAFSLPQLKQRIQTIIDLNKDPGEEIKENMLTSSQETDIKQKQETKKSKENEKAKLEKQLNKLVVERNLNVDLDEYKPVSEELLKPEITRMQTEIITIETELQKLKLQQTRAEKKLKEAVANETSAFKKFISNPTDYPLQRAFETAESVLISANDDKNIIDDQIVLKNKELNSKKLEKESKDTELTYSKNDTLTDKTRENALLSLKKEKLDIETQQKQLGLRKPRAEFVLTKATEKAKALEDQLNKVYSTTTDAELKEANEEKTRSQKELDDIEDEIVSIDDALKRKTNEIKNKESEVNEIKTILTKVSTIKNDIAAKDKDIRSLEDDIQKINRPVYEVIDGKKKVFGAADDILTSDMFRSLAVVAQPVIDIFIKKLETIRDTLDNQGGISQVELRDIKKDLSAAKTTVETSVRFEATPLQYAVLAGNRNIVEQLILYGAPIGEKATFTKPSKDGTKYTLTMLAQKRPDKDPNRKDVIALTEEIIQARVDASRDVNDRSPPEKNENYGKDPKTGKINKIQNLIYKKLYQEFIEGKPEISIDETRFAAEIAKGKADAKTETPDKELYKPIEWKTQSRLLDAAKIAYTRSYEVELAGIKGTRDGEKPNPISNPEYDKPEYALNPLQALKNAYKEAFRLASSTTFDKGYYDGLRAAKFLPKVSQYSTFLENDFITKLFDSYGSDQVKNQYRLGYIKGLNELLGPPPAPGAVSSTTTSYYETVKADAMNAGRDDASKNRKKFTTPATYDAVDTRAAMKVTDPTKPGVEKIPIKIKLDELIGNIRDVLYFKGTPAEAAIAAERQQKVDDLRTAYETGFEETKKRMMSQPETTTSTDSPLRPAGGKRRSLKQRSRPASRRSLRNK